MTVVYEWDVEMTVEYPCGENDVLEHHHFERLGDAIAFAAGDPGSHPDGDVMYAVVLVRDDSVGRSWAYLEEGSLPEAFMTADGKSGAAVPKRFHRDVAATLGRRGDLA